MSALPPNWTLTTMGEICDIVSGSTPRTSDPENWGGPIPWITPDDLSGYAGKSIDGGRRSLTEKGYMSCSAQLVPVGTVLYTSRAPIGYVAIASRSVCTNQGFKSFLPPDGVLSDYIFWYLKYATPEIRKMGSGTTFPEISKKRAESIPIPIAPTAEQRRIVAAIEERFSRIDTGVEALQRARRNMRRMRAAVVQAAVTARLVPQDPNDEPAALLLRRLLGERQAAWSSNGHRGRYRQPDEPKGVLGDIPSGWAWTTVGQLAVRIDYGTSARCSAELKDGVPVLRMGNIQDGELDFSDLKYLPNDHSEIENLLLLDGDILFNRTNSTELVGKSAVFRSFSRPMIFASYLIRLRLSPFVDPRWISMFINGPVGRSYVAAVRVQQVGQANVNGTKLAAMPIALPPASEQRRILEEVDRQLSTIKALDSLVSQAELRGSQLKRGILARGFAGQLVSQDPSEEPVSVLLGRIRAARDAGLSAFHRARRDLR